MWQPHDFFPLVPFFPLFSSSESHSTNTWWQRSSTYLILCWYQQFFNHHAVSGIRASVQRVGPIRTEGAEAVVFTIYHRKCRWQWDEQKIKIKKLIHATSRDSIRWQNIHNLWNKYRGKKWNNKYLHIVRYPPSLQYAQGKSQQMFTASAVMPWL